MATRAGLFLIILLVNMPLTPEFSPELIVWNVGQGQWVTIADDRGCWHFDAGGEFAPWRAIQRRCGGRRNAVTFSHWDLDHVGFAGQLGARLTNACVLHPPLGRANVRKRNLMSRLKACVFTRSFATWVDETAVDTNGRSRVSLVEKILIPGDAPSVAERRFVPRFRGLAGTRWLVLGHHGSRTSTSRELLNAATDLIGAIASARRARYGHPHAETLERLSRARVPVLVTEDWGNVHVAL